jgi:hypothetical protein
VKVTPTTDGRFTVTQSFIPPTVYLDHWAVRALTDEPVWQDRFVEALKAAGGTLMLSHLTFTEFANVADPRHATDTEHFLDRVFPNVFLASIDLRDVLRQELRARPHAPTAPPADAALTEYFVTKQPPRSFVGMISPLSRTQKLRAHAAIMNRTIAAHINRVRREPAFIKASRTFTAHEPGAPALAVFRELARIPGIDQQMRIEPNDSTDFQHAVVALAYCSFALLDRKWTDFGGRVQRNLTKLGVPLRLAKSFPKSQMTTFLEALENHPNLGYVRAGG